MAKRREHFTQTWLDAHRVSLPEIERASIVGIGHVMAEVDSLLARLREPELAESLGLELPRGVLLWGDPGLGKTLVARYLATRIGSDVPFYEVSSDELTPERLRGAVRYLAERHERAVLYLDEIDQWAMSRDSLGYHSSATRLLLTAALAALDGLVPASGLLLIASSNRSPRALDGALIRSGRIGFHIPFDHPDEDERLALLTLFIGSRPTDGSVELDTAARLTRDRTPADLRAVVGDGFGMAFAAGRRRLSQADLVAAIQRAGEAQPDDELDPAIRHRLAVHEAGHAAVACVLRGSSWVYSIIIRALDGATSHGSEKTPLALGPDQEQLDAIAVAMAGIAAESLLLDDGPSLGGTDDISLATRIAISRLDAGLDATVPPISLNQMDERMPEWLRELQGRAIVRVLDEARERATQIVGANLVAIGELAATIEASGELVGDGLEAALTGRFTDRDGNLVR